MELFLSALGLALVIEGLPYAVAPRKVRQIAEILPHLSNGILQILGVVVMLLGLSVIFISRLGSGG
ncbi:MAG: DUF2065 domain-containing protein [Nitrospirota bacterium]